MKRAILLRVLVFSLFPLGMARGQISPGELSAAHADLEGMSNCTRCHTIGRTVTHDRCLDCHRELKSRIAAGKGYHARIAARECVDCHKEHHGRSFAITRFDRTGYDHKLATGFALEGKHAQLECQKCHRSDLLRAADVKSNQSLVHHGTYLGLSPACASCHDDVHRGQFSGDCSTCHTPSAWKPVGNFSHDRTRFRLTGKHTEVPCASCHKALPADPKTVRFKGLAFQGCKDCHADPHKGKLQGTCESCHATAGWTQAGTTFNHATTRFPLNGLHSRVRCIGCHTATAGASPGHGLRFARFQRCADCHPDPHKGQFASRIRNGGCESCHAENGWHEGPMKTFDHATTRFPLRGKHAVLECATCHGTTPGVRVTPDMLTGFARCAACHPDPHAGQFTRGGAITDCGTCHNEDRFVPAAYSTAMHNANRFSLNGGHEAVPCVKCHATEVIAGKRVQVFARASLPACVACHQDPHGGKLARFTAAGCTVCHTSTMWTDIHFDHSQTRYPLDGKHVRVACARCHAPSTGSRAPDLWQFQGVATACAGCHGGAAPAKSTGSVREGGRKQ